MIIIAASSSQFCFGQISPLDSCGLNLDPTLNKYEMLILDSLFFTKKKSINKGFDFKDKNVAFYSCTKNSDTKRNGFLTKIDFFSLCRHDFKGHAGRGFISFDEKEKAEAKGIDLVILIDCPYDLIDKAQLIQKLLKRESE